VPAPAVIPALIAYINVVAVKGFVVEFRVQRFCCFNNDFSSVLCIRRGRSQLHLGVAAAPTAWLYSCNA
jgi:hypothetical protein